MSFRKFGISSETFFDVLHIKNRKLEQLQANLANGPDQEEESKNLSAFEPQEVIKKTITIGL